MHHHWTPGGRGGEGRCSFEPDASIESVLFNFLEKGVGRLFSGAVRSIKRF